MGYSTAYNYRTGRWSLCCDKCGRTGGVRKRTCRFEVTGDSLRGPRWTLPYCPPPALCGDCYKNLGGARGVHGDRCRDGAAASQAEYDEVEANLDNGLLYPVSALGNPDGTVSATFSGRAGQVKVLLPPGQYDRTVPRSLPDLLTYAQGRAA